MKSKLLLLCLVLWPALMASAAEPMEVPEFRVIENQSPAVAVPETWSYGSAPGSYFWNGFYTGAVICAFCWIFSLIKTGISDDHEEL